MIYYRCIVQNGFVEWISLNPKILLFFNEEMGKVNLVRINSLSKYTKDTDKRFTHLWYRIIK